jgi:hypothetical protein
MDTRPVARQDRHDYEAFIRLLIAGGAALSGEAYLVIDLKPGPVTFIFHDLSFEPLIFRDGSGPRQY